jgi:DHA2 family multidrug resistance protein
LDFAGVQRSRAPGAFHQSRLAEAVIPSNIGYRHTLRQMTQYFVDHRSSLLQAPEQALAWIGQQVQSQAAYLAYIDVFWTLMVLAAATIPLTPILRKSTPAPATATAH